MSVSADGELVVEAGYVCDDHYEELADWDIPSENALYHTHERAMVDETFYEIAFRIKNGNPPPEGKEPGPEEITATFRELAPLCCWLVDNCADPYPEQPGTAYIHILTEHAKAKVNAQK